MKKIASFISILGNPLLTIPIFVLIVMFGTEDFSKASLVSFLIIGCVFIPMVLWMYFKSKNGSYTNFDVSDRIQRNSLFTFVIPLLFLVYIALILNHQSKNLCISVLFALIMLIISEITNLFIKSSLHVSFNIYLTALIFSVNVKMAVIFFLFTMLIGWSRVYLGRHSKKEIFVGFIIGLIIGVVMLQLEGYS